MTTDRGLTSPATSGACHLVLDAERAFSAHLSAALFECRPRRRKEDPQPWQSGRAHFPRLSPPFVGTWPLMPLRVSLALKHNRKRCPLRGELNWRSRIERPRTSDHQRSPADAAFLPPSF